MAFQFKNKETKQIYYLNEIDTIVANFWGKEVHPRRYATPTQGGSNWFDVLGRAIEDLQYFHRKEEDGSLYYHRSCSVHNHDAEFEMNEVAPMILCDFTRWNHSADEVYTDVDILRPYVELCFHLHTLGIVGVGRGW